MLVTDSPEPDYAVFVQRFLLLLVLFLLFALPLVSGWFYNAVAGWYRPYLLWLIFIGITAMVNYSKDRHAV